MKLSGRLCSLVDFQESHLPSLRSFLANEEVMSGISTLRGKTSERFLKWIVSEEARAAAAVFSIAASEAPREDIIGITLLRFSDSARKSAVSGTLLGNTQHWGSGIGLESATLKFDYGFKKLALETIYASALARNARSTNLIARLGYQRMSARPAAISDNGDPDRSFYELSRETWLTSHPETRQ